MDGKTWRRRITAACIVGAAVSAGSLAGMLLAAEPPIGTLAEPQRGQAPTAERRAAEGEPDASRKRTDEFVQRFMSRRERLGNPATSPAAAPSSPHAAAPAAPQPLAGGSAAPPPDRLASRLKLIDGPPGSSAAPPAGSAPPSNAVSNPGAPLASGISVAPPRPLSINPITAPSGAAPSSAAPGVAYPETPPASAHGDAGASHRRGGTLTVKLPANDAQAPSDAATPRPSLLAAPEGAGRTGKPRAARLADASTGEGERPAATANDGGLIHHLAQGPLAQLTIERQGPTELSIGEPANYRLTIRNTGATPVEHVHLEVLLPAKSYALPDDGARRERLAWKLGTIGPKSTVTVPVNFICREAGDAKLETWLFSPSIDQSTIKVVEPTLLVDLAPAGELRVGQAGLLNVTVRNTGKGVARDVKLAIELPENLRETRETSGTKAIGELAAGASMRFEVPVQVVGPGATSTRTIVSAAGGLELPSQHPIDVLAPKVKLSTNSVTEQNIGEIEMYSAEIVNDGTLPLEWVTVIVTLDRGLLLVDAEAGAEIDPGMRLLGWELPKLAPGATRTLRWWAVAQRPGEGRQQVFVESEGGVKAETTIVTDLKAAAAVGLQVTERDPEPAVGEEVIYQVRLFNHSNVVAEELVLTCDLPEGLEPVWAVSPGERTWQGRKAVFGPLAPLAPGENRVFQVRARSEKTGWHTLKLTLSQGVGGPIVAEASEETRIRGKDDPKPDSKRLETAPSPPTAIPPAGHGAAAVD